MQHALLALTVGPDGKVTASLADWGGEPPYRLALLVNELAEAFNEGGIERLRESLRQLAIEPAARSEWIN